jgi:hypothetical protein
LIFCHAAAPERKARERGDDRRERSEELLAALKDWTSASNANITTALCLVIAAKLIGGRISALAG